MKYILEFGAPRSGTTYLEYVLDGFDGAQRIYAELLPRTLMNVYGGSNLVDRESLSSIDSSVKNILSRGIGTFINNRYNSRFLALESWWNRPRDVEQLWHVVRPGRRPLPSLVIYRSTHLSFSPELVFESIPDAKVIYIYRDGRDVANSLVESYNAFANEGLSDPNSEDVRLGRKYGDLHIPWWVDEGREETFASSTQYVRALWFWDFIVGKCIDYFDSLSNEERSRLLVLKYENLVSAPEEVGDKICTHLDMQPSFHFKKRLKEARASSIGKHKQRPKDELSEGKRVARKTLSKLDYI